MPFFKTSPGVDLTLMADLLKQRQGIPPGTLTVSSDVKFLGG
jgi:hypothetical protein